MPLSHLPSSYRAHLALMGCGFVAAMGIVLCLVLGWRGHFDSVATRQRLAVLSTQTDQHQAETSARRPDGARAAMRERGLERSAAQEPTVAHGTAKGLTLADLATQQEGGQFPEPIPLLAEAASDRLREALDTLQRFTRAERWRDKLPCVADAQRVEPLMHTYYEARKSKDPESTTTRPAGHFKLNNTEVLLFSSPSRRRPGGASDLAMVAPVKGGKFSVDWESFVGAGDMGWQDFMQLRPVAPKLFRLYAAPDDYFNDEFGDAARYQSMRLTSPDGLHVVYGYCERDSEVGKTLSSLLGKKDVSLPLTLRLSYPESAQSDHCVKIVGVVANRWLIVK